jgi:MFS family permease
MLVPVWGRLSNIFGRRVSVLTAMGLFGFGTLVSAVARNMVEMISGRIIAGSGGGGCLTLSMIIIGERSTWKSMASSFVLSERHTVL